MIKVKLRPEQGIKVKTTPVQSPDVKLKTVYLYDADWIPEINKAVEEANESAESAKTSAESAEASANSAAESARNADADADNASESAGLAAQEAQKAIDAATKATKEADAAAESAYQSQQSALAAAEYAQNVSSDAENALESLEHVLASVAEAKTSELNAKDSETKAKESEQKATQEANASAESAYQSQQSSLAAYEYASNAEADASNVRETLDLVLDAETAATKAAQTATEKAQQATDGANIATQKAGVSTEQANIAIEKADEASQFALECQEIKNSLGSVYKYKGSVNTFDDLPTVGNEIGDVYNIIDTDANYAWDGEKWDILGSVVDLSLYYTKTEVDGLVPTKTSELENDSGFLTDVPAYKSLNETQKAEVINFGTYEGEPVENGEIFTENDGKFVKAKAGTTTAPESFTHPYIISGAFGHGGRLVTTPNRSAQQAAYSDDHGVTWTTFNEPFTRVRGWLHNGTYWLGLTQGDYGTVQCKSSVDGVTWSSSVTIASGDFLDSYGVLNGVFYVCTRISGSTSAEYYYSENGTSWTKGIKPAEVFKIVCRKNDIVLLSKDGKVFVSTDGQTWKDTGVSYGLSFSSGWDTAKLSCLFGKIRFTWKNNTVSSKDLSSWSSDVALPDYFLEVSDSFAIGVNGTGSISSFLTTTDGEVWNSVSLPGSMPDFYALATTGDGYFYLFDEDVTTGYKASYQKISLESLSYNKAEVDALISEETSPFATKEYVDTTEQEIIQNFMEADTDLQTQINGQATAIAGKQDKLTAGENIQIDGNVISSTGGGSEEDNITITKTGEGKIQAVAVIDSNASYPIKIWTGTKEEYDSIELKDSSTIYNVIDDIKTIQYVCFMPDYSTATEIDSGWVAPYDCVGYCESLQRDNNDVIVYVDGVKVYRQYGGAYPKAAGSQWLVPKGSIVTYSGSFSVSPTVYQLKGRVA